MTTTSVPEPARIPTWVSGGDQTRTLNCPPATHRIHTGTRDYAVLGIRSDAESSHSQYERTLIVNRVMSLVAKRGLADLYCFSLCSNAMTEYRHQQHTQHGDRTRTTRVRRPAH